VRQWLDGVEPAWTLLAFDSLRALRQEPSAGQTAIQIANDLSADEIAGSAVARNTLILLRRAIERGGLGRGVCSRWRIHVEWPRGTATFGDYGKLADVRAPEAPSTKSLTVRCARAEPFIRHCIRSAVIR